MLFKKRTFKKHLFRTYTRHTQRAKNKKILTDYTYCILLLKFNVIYLSLFIIRNIFLSNILPLQKTSLSLRSLNVRLKNAFLFLIRSFIVSYQKVMNNRRESVDKKGIVLVKLPIKCSQVIELQFCNSSSKPPRNTFF